MSKVSLPAKTWPTSPGQKRLWVIAALDEEASAAYNMPVALRLDGDLDVDALAAAFHEVMMQHEALRTTFADVDGEPRQIVHDEPLAALERVDLSGEADAESVAREIAAKHAAARFDLATGPLLRAAIIRLGRHQYVLLFNIHHIICDEWSLGVLVSGLTASYAQGRRGMSAAERPALRLQYKDYAAWQNQLLEGDELQRQRRYWDDKLSGAVTAVNLPADRARPPRKSYAGRALTVDLPARLVSDLRQLAAAQRTTPFAALVALVKVLLFRYTGQTDITIGCPVAGREHPDLVGQVGFFVNTLALRDRVRAGESFVEILDRVKTTVTEALQHQAYPFDDLVSRLSPERDPSRSPIFDVSINLTPATGGTAIQFPGVTASGFDIGYARAKVDLSFDFTETPDALQLTLIYSPALFDDRRIWRLARHFEQLATAACANPRRDIALLRLLSESEERELRSFAGADYDYPRGETIVDLFERQAERRSEHLALQSDAEVVTYGELHRRSNQLARLLLSLGAGRDVPVGVLMDRGPAMMAAVLAIFKAGAAYLPLDRSLPPVRIADMVNDSLTPIIVTDAASEGALPSFIGTPLNLDTEAAEIATQSTEPLATRPDPGDLAYLIYTSGSTGIPKAVAVEHRGLTNVAAVQGHLFGVMPDDRVLQFAAPGFDASLFEISMALCWGATLRLGSRERLLPGEPLPRFLGDERVSILTLPPSALAVTAGAHLPCLRLVNVAGEACPPELPASWGKARQFFNLYGPSEATIWSTAASFDAGQIPPSIGKPIPNTRVYVVAASLQPVPIGVPGEIVIGGVGVARGYLHRPAFTAERFLPDPFGPAGARLFRTGDIGRWRADGTIEFLGRADHQVKIRGYRVELGEIEAVLARHPRVRAAAVVYRPHQNGAMQLGGYVVPAGDRVDVQELRAWLRASLPEYMVPATITALHAFPTGASGKIDKSALPDAHADALDVSRGLVAPRTPLESVLARMFAEVLGREQVGVTENFFDIGGHSLMATRVVSRLRELFHVEFSLAQFFQENTVAQVADALNTMQPETAEKVARALEQLRAMSPEQKQQLRARSIHLQHDPI